jgi:hypothetical protein
MVIQSETGTYVSEEQLRRESATRSATGGYEPDNGTAANDVSRMLRDHGVTPGRWDRSVTIEDIESATAGDRRAILFVDSPTHYMVVDGVRSRPDGSRALQVRDPGRSGSGGCREIVVGESEWNTRVRTSWLLPVGS